MKEQTFKTDEEREEYSDLLWTMHQKYEALEKKVNAMMEAKWSTKTELQKIADSKRSLKMQDAKRNFRRPKQADRQSQTIQPALLSNQSIQVIENTNERLSP